MREREIEHGEDWGPKVKRAYIEVQGRSQAKIRSREAGREFQDGH